MRRQLVAAGVVALLLRGPSTRAADAPALAPSSNAEPAALTQGPTTVVAQAGDAAVTAEQLMRPLIEGYGLNILLNLVQLEIAKQNATKAGAIVTPADLETERSQTIEKMFKESNEKLTDKINVAREKGNAAEADKLTAQMRQDNEQAFEQFLARERLTRAEFNLVTETNTYLRKMAEPMLAGKITDENLQEAFRQLYGETVKCRHIQCSNIKEIQEARSRLAGGEPFAKVARDMSRNPSTGPLGGELPPFSLQMQGLPQAFKDAAFALKNEGDVSDIVQADGAFHLILLEKRIPPKAVKFEDVKESIRTDLHDRALDATVKQLRRQVEDQAMKNIVVQDPVLKEQWQARLTKRDALIKDQQEIRKQMQLERERAATQPAVTPDLAPAK